MKNKTEKSLWDMFSKYIRLRDANWQGYVNCISCSTVLNWKSADAGHYIPIGSDRALKYNEVNVNSQCTSCNRFKHGNQIEYRRGLINKYNEKTVKDLEASHFFKTTKKKLDQISINLLYDLYKKKVDELKKQKSL